MKMASSSDKVDTSASPLRDNSAKKGQSFLQGAMILTLGGIIVKLIGALFKIPITSFLGADGSGYFNTAYQIYLPLYSLATAGFPIAIARMVAENVATKKYRDVRQIYRSSFPIFITTGLIGFAIMFFGAYPYTTFLSKNPNAVYCVMALAPTVFFCCLMSIYRGYYEGLRNMYPTAISQVIEALCKLIFGIALAYLLFNAGIKQFKSGQSFLFFEAVDTSSMTAEAAETAILQAVYPIAAAGAIMGVTIGGCLGLLFMIIYHKRKGDGLTQEQLNHSPKPLSRKSTVSTLISIAVPIGIGALLVNLTSFIDSFMLLRRLSYLMNNFSDEIIQKYGELLGGRELELIPNYFYGAFGFALTLYQLVPALAQAFGVSALPSVTTAWATKDKSALKKSIESVVRISALIIIPAGLGMSALAGPILNLIYGSAANANAVQIATPILIVLGLAVIGSALSSPFTSMLQAVGRVDLPVIFTVITAAIKIGCNYVLVGIPSINVHGAGYGTLFCYIFLLIAEWIALVKITKVSPNFISVFIKPMIAGLICAATAYASQGFIAGILGDKIATLAALALAVIVYAVSLVLLRAVHRDDVLMLPKGEKIAKALAKRKLIV